MSAPIGPVIDFAQGETRKLPLGITDDEQPTSLTGVTLYLGVEDMEGNPVPALSLKTGDGIAHDEETGEALLTWSHARTAAVTPGLYAYTLWSVETVEGEEEWQQLYAPSPLEVGRAGVVIP